MEPNWRNSWEEALKNYECSSGQYVCTEHFSSDDYHFTNRGTRISLNQNAIPTIFNELIEIDVSENQSNNEEQDTTKAILLENEKLHQKIRQIKSEFESYKIVMNTRIKKSATEANESRKQLAAIKIELKILTQTIKNLNEEIRILSADKVSLHSKGIVYKIIITIQLICVFMILRGSLLYDEFFQKIDSI